MLSTEHTLGALIRWLSAHQRSSADDDRIRKAHDAPFFRS